MTIYPKALISRIKGALRAGLRPKQISYLTGIPRETIREWSTEDSQAAVEADESVIRGLKFALTGDADDLTANSPAKG